MAERDKLDYVLFRDYQTKDRARFDHFESHGYTPLQNLPEAVLEIHWKRFEDYVADMRSNYRRRVKLNLAKIADKHIRSELLDDFRHLSDQFVAQWTTIYDNATEYKREVLTRAFYDNINAQLPNAKALVFYKNNQLIAHCLLLFEGDVLRWMYVGKDGDESEDLYPFMLYEIVRHAIAANVRWVKLGITTYIAKTDIGADIVPLFMYMKHRTRLFPKLAPWLFKQMTPLPALKEKNVFKTQRRPAVAVEPNPLRMPGLVEEPG